MKQWSIRFHSADSDAIAFSNMLLKQYNDLYFIEKHFSKFTYQSNYKIKYIKEGKASILNHIAYLT